MIGIEKQFRCIETSRYRRIPLNIMPQFDALVSKKSIVCYCTTRIEFNEKKSFIHNFITVRRKYSNPVVVVVSHLKSRRFF